MISYKGVLQQTLSTLKNHLNQIDGHSDFKIFMISNKKASELSEVEIEYTEQDRKIVDALKENEVLSVIDYSYKNKAACRLTVEAVEQLKQSCFEKVVNKYQVKGLVNTYELFKANLEFSENYEIVENMFNSLKEKMVNADEENSKNDNPFKDVISKSIKPDDFEIL